MNTMNTAEITDVIPETYYVESTAIEEFDRPEQPAPRAVRRRALDYAFLMTVLAWLTFSVQSSINEINAEIDAIRANIVLPL